MFKRIMCFLLIATMICGVFMLSSCGESSTQELSERLPVTISVLGITSEETTPEATAAVQKAINDIMGASYSTHIELTLVTADKYYDLVNERVAMAIYNENRDTAIQNYNTAAVAAANSLSEYRNFGKWRSRVSSVQAETIATSAQSTDIVTRLNEQGVLEVVYPAAASPIDVVMIIGEDMYNDFSEKGILTSLRSSINSESYTKFNQYIYPLFLQMLQAITGDIYAVPNNNLLGEYTYVIVKKDIAEKYNFDIETVNGYADLSDFLASVKENEDVIPMNSVPDALGIFRLFSDENITIGTYCDPLSGFDRSENEGATYTVSDIFDIPEYISHVALMDEYKKNGYFTSASGSDDFAVDVIRGDASVAAKYGDEYDVKILQNPFVEKEKIFAGMLGVSSYTSSLDRSLEFILELTTNPEIKNLFQYGIENENYSVNKDGTITRLNRSYIMDNGTTGNVYMGYPEEGMLADQWDYVKKTNIDAVPNPYVSYYTTSTSYILTYNITDAVLDSVLSSALTRAIINSEFARLGSDRTYDYYEQIKGGANEASVGNIIKYCTDYKDYFIEKIIENELSSYKLTVTRQQAESLFNSPSASSGNPRYSYDWYFAKVVELKVAELYSTIYTNATLDAAINQVIASSAGTTPSNYDSAVKLAAGYYNNIDKLKIMARILIWDDLSDEEWKKYENMGAAAFEEAVFEYVRDNYIKENDLTDEKYDILVKTFIMNQLSFTNADDNSIYGITWDEYMNVKKNAKPFFSVVENMRAAYADVLSSIGDRVVNATAENNIPALIHDSLYNTWLSENGYRLADTFENELNNEMVEFLGITYSEFVITRRSNTTKFTEYMTSIKNQYRNIIVDAYSEAQFKNDNISNDNVLKAILNYKIEERTGIYASMCETVGITYNEYKSGLSNMTTYILYANQLRTRFIYTLLAYYDIDQINNFAYDDIDGIVYDVMYNFGFYINEMCVYVSTSLSSYMSEKSNVKSYTEYIDAATTALSSDLEAMGYTKAQVMDMNYEDAVEVLYEVVKGRYFSDAMLIKRYLANTSGEYAQGVKVADNVSEYVAAAAQKLGENGVFTSVIYYLNKSLSEAIAALS